MKKAVYLLLLVSGSALANDAAILKCRTISDNASRVSCYDAIPVGAQAGGVTAPAATAAPAAAPAVAARSAEQSFGMEKANLPQTLESTIVGDFEGWEAGAQFKLSNGQVWRVTDGSTAVESRTRNPKVQIVRGFMGVMYMKIEGVNRSPKVRRVQ